MDATSALRHGSRIFALPILLATAAISVFGCDQSDARAQPKDVAAASQTSDASDAPKQAPADAGQSSYKEEAFHLSLEGPDSVKIGEPAVFKVVLSAQSGYKVNDEYPLKFQFAEMAKIAPAKKIVRKEDAKVEKLRAEMPLSVTVQAPGKHRISGKLSFSVCTDERCLIEKRDLSVDLNAS